MKVLVTGASGFVGGGLVDRLSKDGHTVIAASRERPRALPDSATFVTLHDLGLAPALSAPCAVDVVVHLAARVHVMHEAAAAPLALFRAVNVAGTLSVARQARSAGARRFVFLSSLKVLGERSRLGHPLTAEDLPLPTDPYGISKLEAEQELTKFCKANGMELVVVRPPLVYGPGVKGNFRKLMAAVARRIPLPLAAVRDNRRSLVSLDNLVDLLAACVAHPAAPGHAFLVSDGEDLSTAELVHRIGAALDVQVSMVPVPVWLLEPAGRAVGRSEAVQRLCGTLQVDIEPTCRALTWHPRYRVNDGLLKTATWFLRQGSP